jgi:hypothetical protein
MDSGIGVARRRHSVMRCAYRCVPRCDRDVNARCLSREKTRMSCMYEYNQNPDGKGGFVLGQITSIKSVVRGCAAGSVWEDDKEGRVVLSSRTAESLGSVWRKVCSAAPDILLFGLLPLGHIALIRSPSSSPLSSSSSFSSYFLLPPSHSPSSLLPSLLLLPPNLPPPPAPRPSPRPPPPPPLRNAAARGAAAAAARGGR